MISGLRHGDKRADPQPLWTRLYLVEGRLRQSLDVDKRFGPHDIEPHQVDKGRAAGKILDRGRYVRISRRGSLLDRLRRTLSLNILERSHG
jgi:hypothetical protein